MRDRRNAGGLRASSRPRYASRRRASRSESKSSHAAHCIDARRRSTPVDAPRRTRNARRGRSRRGNVGYFTALTNLRRSELHALHSSDEDVEIDDLATKRRAAEAGASDSVRTGDKETLQLNNPDANTSATNERRAYVKEERPIRRARVLTCKTTRLNRVQITC